MRSSQFRTAPASLPNERATERGEPVDFRAISAVGVRARERAAARLTPGGVVLATLWCSYLVLCPFYFFDSGLPQIADGLIVLAFGLLVLMGRLALPRGTRTIIGALSLLVLYMTAVNSVWAAALDETLLLRFPCFYVFNLLACLLFCSLYDWLGVRFLNWTAAALLVSIGIQTLLCAAGIGKDAERAVIFFNNPNQLGFYAILVGTVLWIWSRNASMPTSFAILLSACVYPAVVYLTLMSMSRAAMVGGGLLLVLSSVGRARTVVAGFGAAIIALVAIESAQSDFGILDRIHARLDRKSQTLEEESETRGYDRILRHPEHLVLGAGEGAIDRFDATHEIHSTIGAIAFSYGMVGLGLFGRVFWLLGFRIGISSLMYLAPSFCYGMTHNGLRQTLFWITIVFVASAAATRGRVRNTF